VKLWKLRQHRTRSI